jgi:hypothetical protein
MEPGRTCDHPCLLEPESFRGNVIMLNAAKAPTPLYPEQVNNLICH